VHTSAAVAVDSRLVMRKSGSGEGYMPKSPVTLGALPTST